MIYIIKILKCRKEAKNEIKMKKKPNNNRPAVMSTFKMTCCSKNNGINSFINHRIASFKIIRSNS